MKSELLTVKAELEKKKNRIGLIGTRLNVQEVAGNTLAAHITTDWKEIELSYGSELTLVPDKETERFVRVRSITNPIMKVGEDILDHEAGHRENRVGERYGCPHTLETHEQIKDAVARGLETVGKKGLETYVTNAFEDVLDNINCRRYTDFAGQTLFWNNQGLVNGQEGKFNKFYDAFVHVNLVLGGKAPDYTLLRRFSHDAPEVREAAKAFLAEMRTATGEQKLFALHDKQGFKRLFNNQDLQQRAELWSQLGYSFAVHLGKLLEEMPQQRMFGSAEGNENSTEQNPFDREMKMPHNRQKIAFGRYSQGKEVAAHREPEEQLYDLYKHISKEIPVETSHYSASQSMPLVKFGRRFVKEDERKFKFRGVGFTGEGDIALRTSKHDLQYPVAYKVHPHKFPKFKLALMDRSGSMALNTDNEREVGNTSFIPWGDQSKYHYALKGYFGIDNFLERQGVAPYVESCVLGFSGENVVRGKSAEVAKSLLVKPSGDTSLDISGLERELEDNALVLSLSDGDFLVSESDKERFEEKIKRSDYAHIQIGGATAFSQYLEGLGVPVIQVKGDEDLSRTMVSFVSSYYRNKGSAK